MASAAFCFRSSLKGTDFDNYSVGDVEYSMDSLNSRPRKRLNYFTPMEVFVKNGVALTC
jgi:IS30 family transposase